MTKKIRIAVVSDLHIGKKTIAMDLCPHELSPEQRVGLTPNFLELFRQHVSSAEFAAEGPIDFLCVTGDISDKADPAEFELASAVISEIADSLKVGQENIYYVPGNHDVHWPIMNLTPSHFWNQYRYDPLLQPGLIFHTQIESAQTGSYHESPHFVAWVANNRLIIGINSSAYDSPIPEHGKHHGLILQSTIDELGIFLDKLPIDSDQLRICLLHHHPIIYSDPRPNEPDFSAATNSEHLFQLLSKFRFDVVIHGHKHVPHVSHHTISNGHPITILGAGSLSARLDSQWVGAAQNQFHVISIEGRSPTTHGVFGYVSTWDFISGTWRNSHSRNGLFATEGFGSLSTPQELTAVISGYVDSEISANKMCAWETLETYHPALAHVNTKIAFETFDEVGKAKGLLRFGEMDSAERRWTLLIDPKK